ncbi:MAG: hypothetical protein LE179_05325 [Endomicrobium sp.]|nr:hypothetical protein [Endomicrobium sp.]
MRLAGLPPESIKRGMDNMLLPEDAVPLTRYEAGQAMNEIWLRRQFHTSTHDDTRTPNDVGTDFGTLRIGLHLPQDGQGNTGVMRCMNRQRNSAAWVVQDVTLAAAAERDNQALREDADAHMAAEIRHLDQTVLEQREQMEEMRTENLQLKVYIDKHGGSPILHSLNSKMEASISQERQAKALNNGLSIGHQRGYQEHKMKSQAEVNEAYNAGIELGTAQGIEKGIEMQIGTNPLKLLHTVQEQGAARKKPFKCDTWGQTDMPPNTRAEAKTETNRDVKVSDYARDSRIYIRGWVEGWHAGFKFGRSSDKDFMKGHEDEAYALYGRTNRLRNYDTACAFYGWEEI